VIEEEDRGLVQRFLRQRDESSFRILYRRHTPALFALAVRLLDDRHEAEDALQDAWIRAAHRLVTFRWESQLRSWLAGIVLNCCRERRRDAWRWLDPPASEIASLDDAPLEINVDLERAIADLPPGARAVFLLHDVEGHTHEEIGELLNVRPGTSKSQLSCARRRLRLRLGASEEGR
jgi:RNA polymerase sigma-70 factor (ECF subfamily)